MESQHTVSGAKVAAKVVCGMPWPSIRNHRSRVEGRVEKACRFAPGVMRQYAEDGPRQREHDGASDASGHPSSSQGDRRMATGSPSWSTGTPLHDR